MENREYVYDCSDDECALSRARGVSAPELATEYFTAKQLDENGNYIDRNKPFEGYAARESDSDGSEEDYTDFATDVPNERQYPSYVSPLKIKPRNVKSFFKHVSNRLHALVENTGSLLKKQTSQDGRCLADLLQIKSELYCYFRQQRASEFRDQQDRLMELSSKCTLKKWMVGKHSLLVKGFYVLLYDDTRNCTVASLEHFDRSFKINYEKSRRQNWVKDSVANLLVDDTRVGQRSKVKGADGFECGHFVSHGNWNYNKKMVREMSVTTNAFPQLKGFNGYKDVEVFSRQLSSSVDYFAITCPIDNCRRIVKVILCTKKSSTAIMAFDFPNTKIAYDTLTAVDRRCGGSFMTDSSTLSKLPFDIEIAKDAVFIQKRGWTWKRQAIKAVENLLDLRGSRRVDE